MLAVCPHVEEDDLDWCVGHHGYELESDTDPRTRRPIVTMWKRTTEPWRNVSRGGARLDLGATAAELRAPLKRFPRTFSRRLSPLAERVPAAIDGGAAGAPALAADGRATRLAATTDSLWG